MTCIDGCGDCCGVVPASGVEYDRVMAYAAEYGIEPVLQGVTCPWFQDGGCAVYEARPTACRLYGHCEGMTCPHGRNVNVSLTVERRMLLDIGYELRSTGVRMLHEAVVPIDELEDFIRPYLRPDGMETGSPAAHAYAGARSMKVIGLGFADTLFVDPNTKEMT